MYNVTEQHECEQAQRRVSSRYKGVSWHKRDKKFYAAIKLNGRPKHLGAFIDEREAARAYDAAAREHFGDFAVCNFPPKFLV
jgi:hypothetical protein